jgi:hypothetical protein
MVFIIVRHFTKTAISALLKWRKMAVVGALTPRCRSEQEKADVAD